MSKKNEPKERDALKMVVGRRTHGAGPHADKRKGKGGSHNWNEYMDDEELAEFFGEEDEDENS